MGLVTFFGPSSSVFAFALLLSLSSLAPRVSSTRVTM
jgi:hypothetical protein